MSCKDINNLITAFLDEELTDKERYLVKAHLTTCQHCEIEMEAIASIQDDLRNAFRLEASRYSPSSRVWHRLQQYITGQGQAATIITRIRNILPFPRRLSWKTGLIGLLVIALVIGLATTIPLFFKQDDKVLAAEIALSNTQVQAFLGGDEPMEVTVLDTIYEEGNIRVIIAVEPDMVVVADVDMGNQEVVSVKVQEIDDITKQQVIDIARADPRVQELFKQGAQIHDLEMVEVYPALLEVWRDINSQLLGVEPEELIGFIGSLSLQLGNSSGAELYYIIVNVTTGKVVTINEPGQNLPGTVITTIITEGKTTMITD